MTLVGKKRLADFCAKHADVRQAVAAWVAEVEEARWESPSAVKARYHTASVINRDRIVFNLKGNHYRLDVTVGFAEQIVIVRRIGTHSEYSSWTF